MHLSICTVCMYVHYVCMYVCVCRFIHSRTVRDFWPLRIDLLLPSGETGLVANFLWNGTATSSACLYFFVFFFYIPFRTPPKRVGFSYIRCNTDMVKA